MLSFSKFIEKSLNEVDTIDVKTWQAQRQADAKARQNDPRADIKTWQAQRQADAKARQNNELPIAEPWSAEDEKRKAQRAKDIQAVKAAKQNDELPIAEPWTAEDEKTTQAKNDLNRFGIGDIIQGLQHAFTYGGGSHHDKNYPHKENMHLYISLPKSEKLTGLHKKYKFLRKETILNALRLAFLSGGGTSQDKYFPAPENVRSYMTGRIG